MKKSLVDEPQHELVNLLRKHLPDQDFLVIFGDKEKGTMQVASNLVDEDEVIGALLTAYKAFCAGTVTVMYRDDKRYD